MSFTRPADEFAITRLTSAQALTADAFDTPENSIWSSIIEHRAEVDSHHDPIAFLDDCTTFSAEFPRECVWRGLDTIQSVLAGLIEALHILAA